VLGKGKRGMAGILLYLRAAWAWDRIVWGASVEKTGELLKNKLKKHWMDWKILDSSGMMI
jgi:hypothetical protein